MSESEKPEVNSASAEDGPRAVPISSAPFEISPASFGTVGSGPVSIAGPELYRDPALDRPQAGIPLSKLIGIGCAVLVVATALTLLLFR